MTRKQDNIIGTILATLIIGALFVLACFIY